MKYKIVLKTSCKHIDRVDNCLKTWLSTLDYVLLTDKLTGASNEISCSNSDDYSSNEEKTVNFINIVRTTDQFDKYDWLVFIDDDAILNISMFEELLPTMDKSIVYGFNMKGVYQKDTSLNYPSGGCSYFISPELINKCKPMSVYGTGFEDVSIGIWMKDNNVHINNLHTLNGWFPWERFFDKLWKDGDKFIPTLIENLSESEIDFLKQRMTHHYIRHKPLMEYINNIINQKSPKN